MKCGVEQTFDFMYIKSNTKEIIKITLTWISPTLERLLEASLAGVP